MKKLSIVIPAYNEEEAIRSIIDRTINAAEKIKAETDIQDVEVIVVNDGSSDRTVEIAQEFSDKNLIHLISYPKNRGYGAAIKLGFDAASGDLVSFLDADGTCDPLWFIQFLQKMKQDSSDIVIGSRLNPESDMPLVRKFGNLFYRDLVKLISSSHVDDIASGMRIIKKSALQKLYPLPDGMHFTPAMSVRAILDRNIKIEEVPIPYKERIGTSKLKVVKDGFRFLVTILEIAFTYKPLRLFGMVGLMFLLLALLYGVGPVLHYMKFRNVPEDRIYRLIFVIVAGISGIQLLSAGLIAQAITNLVHGYELNTAMGRILNRAFLRRLAFFGLLFIFFAIVINVRTIEQYITFRRILVHWSYVVTGGLFILIGMQLLAFSMINRIITLLKEQQHAGRDASLH